MVSIYKAGISGGIAENRDVSASGGSRNIEKVNVDDQGGRWIVQPTRQWKNFSVERFCMAKAGLRDYNQSRV